MIMTLNELFIKQSFIQPIVFKNEDTKETLAKELKIKIMAMRLAMTKIRNQFDKDLQEVTEQLKTEEFKELLNKERTPEEEVQFTTIVQGLEEERQEYITQKLAEEVEFDKTFTEDEYYSIMDINTEDVVINDSPMKNAPFLEVLYTLFVEQ